MLFQIGSESERCLEPERLFDPPSSPSDAAIELLLAATQGRTYTSRLHQLAGELQDIILDHVSIGPIERARVGCLFECRATVCVEVRLSEHRKEEGSRHRTEWTPVELHVCFGKVFSGRAYK
jgi:hypothetical protein